MYKIMKKQVADLKNRVIINLNTRKLRSDLWR